MKKKKDWKKIIFRFVLFSFIIPIGYLIFKIVTTPNLEIPDDIDFRIKSDYILMLIQCLIGIFAILLPSIITKKFRLEIPNKVFYLYLIFLYAAIFLGEIQNFYYKFKYWDLILHTFSGVMIGFIGFSIVDILNKENENVKLNLFFVAFFAFSFAVTLGGIWEIYEFLCDGFFKTNMQKYALESGIKLIGREALTDTMEDLIVDSIGALFASTIGYISIKYNKDYLNNFLIKFKKENHHGEKVKSGGTDETAHLK